MLSSPWTLNLCENLRKALNSDGHPNEYVRLLIKRLEVVGADLLAQVRPVSATMLSRYLMFWCWKPYRSTTYCVHLVWLLWRWVEHIIIWCISSLILYRIGNNGATVALASMPCESYLASNLGACHIMVYVLVFVDSDIWFRTLNCWSSRLDSRSRILNIDTTIIEILFRDNLGHTVQRQSQSACLGNRPWSAWCIPGLLWYRPICQSVPPLPPSDPVNTFVKGLLPVDTQRPPGDPVPRMKLY